MCNLRCVMSMLCFDTNSKGQSNNQTKNLWRIDPSDTTKSYAGANVPFITSYFFALTLLLPPRRTGNEAELASEVVEGDASSGVAFTRRDVLLAVLFPGVLLADALPFAPALFLARPVDGDTLDLAGALAFRAGATF
mmetsp:Transcript_19673/g.33845  ORF Transcript_19673/g.33845 Transcript_19673/m.33845 type:complete len:137 (+) Transcript_19673:40-450(+)